MFTKGNEKLYCKKTNTRMFVAALFLIVENWEQPRYSSVEQWINYDTAVQGNHHLAIKRINH